MKISEEVKKKIEQAANLRLLQGKSSERAFWTGGAEFGVSLMQEEVESAVREWDKLKLRFDVVNREHKQQLGFQDEIEKQMQIRIEQDTKTIESQAKEIERLRNSGAKHILEQAEEILALENKLAEVKEALRREKGLRNAENDGKNATSNEWSV